MYANAQHKTVYTAAIGNFAKL